MKVIVAGSRHCTDKDLVLAAISASGFEITEIVSGCAKGVDTIGEEIAHDTGIPVKLFPADWARYGRGAGPVRNRQMADYADALVAVLFNNSRGTANMIATATKLGLKVHVLRRNE